MKQVILIIVTMSLCVYGMAQDADITSAATALQNQNPDQAKLYIDNAMLSADNQSKPKALFVKAEVYLSLQYINKYKAEKPYLEGARVLLKLKELAPTYETSTADQLLCSCVFFYYNDGAMAFNDQKFAEAAKYMAYAVKICNMKPSYALSVAQKAKFDTVAASSVHMLGNIYYYQGNYSDAIPLLTAAVHEPITKTPSEYSRLIDALQKLNRTQDELAVIQEGRKAFPDDKPIRDSELNYYIATGANDEVLKKLEAAVAKEPGNALLQFDLANTYVAKAMPSNGQSPANRSELIAKAEETFSNAVRLAPDSVTFHYNFGALYFNEAAEVNKQMNAITGNTDADQKKFDALKKQRNAFFVKGLPYFENAASLCAAHEKSLSEEDKKTYPVILQSLMAIYQRVDQMDKYEATKKKLDAMSR